MLIPDGSYKFTIRATRGAGVLTDLGLDNIRYECLEPEFRLHHCFRHSNETYMFVHCEQGWIFKYYHRTWQCDTDPFLQESLYGDYQCAHTEKDENGEDIYYRLWCATDEVGRESCTAAEYFDFIPSHLPSTIPTVSPSIQPTLDMPSKVTI